MERKTFLRENGIKVYALICKHTLGQKNKDKFEKVNIYIYTTGTEIPLLRMMLRFDYVEVRPPSCGALDSLNLYRVFLLGRSFGFLNI